MQIKSLLVHCLLLHAAIGNKLSPTIASKTLTITEAVIDVINKSFLDGIPIINVITAPSPPTNVNDDERTKELMEDISNAVTRNTSSVATVRVGNLDSIHNMNEKRFYNVILISDYKSSTRLNRIINDELFDFSGFFLVVMVRKYENQYKDMEDIFRDMWQHFIINVNILIFNSADELEMFSFYPYTAVYCGRVFPILMNKFVDSSFVSSNKHFDDKLKNLFSCPLTVVTFSIAPMMIVKRGLNGKPVLSGIEGWLLKGKTLWLSMPQPFSLQSKSFSSGATSQFYNQCVAGGEGEVGRNLSERLEHRSYELGNR